VVVDGGLVDWNGDWVDWDDDLAEEDEGLADWVVELVDWVGELADWTVEVEYCGGRTDDDERSAVVGEYEDELGSEQQAAYHDPLNVKMN